MPKADSGYDYRSRGRDCECGLWVSDLGASPFEAAHHDWHHLRKLGDPEIEPSSDAGRLRILLSASNYIAELEIRERHQRAYVRDLVDRIDELERQLDEEHRP